MNLQTFRTRPIIMLFAAARGPRVEQPAERRATLSQLELRRAVAAMID
jgi:hypothetical protein